MATYNLIGDDTNLDHIRGDIATLRKLEHAILESGFGQTVTVDELYQVAGTVEKGLATRVWNCLLAENQLQLMTQSSDRTMPLGLMAKQTEKELLRVPNLGKKGVALLGRFLQSKGTTFGEARDW